MHNRVLNTNLLNIRMIQQLKKLRRLRQPIPARRILMEPTNTRVRHKRAWRMRDHQVPGLSPWPVDKMRHIPQYMIRRPIIRGKQITRPSFMTFGFKGTPDRPTVFARDKNTHKFSPLKEQYIYIQKFPRPMHHRGNLKNN